MAASWIVIAPGQPARGGWAEPEPQFQVNTYTTNRQYQPSVAAAPGGGFLIAWESLGDPLGVTSGLSVVAQRYDADGAPVGESLQVSEGLTGGRGRPGVACSMDDSCVVVWQDVAAAGPDLDSTIRGRRVSSDGAALAAELQINSYTTGPQSTPAAARISDGSFVVTWQSRGSSGTDASSYSIQARRLNALGEPLAADLQVNTATLGLQSLPRLAPLTDGRFVVAWRDEVEYSMTVGARLMSVADPGIEPDEPFVTVAGGEGNDRAYYFDVSSPNPDRVVVVWSHHVSGPYGSTRIEGVIATPSGPIATFPVSAVALAQEFPRISARSDATFVAVWKAAYGDGSSNGIRARAMNGNGSLVAPEIIANAYTTGPQNDPVVAALSDGRFVVAWDSIGSVGNDTSGSSVQARILALEPPVFEDGFETGGYERWSDLAGAGTGARNARTDGHGLTALSGRVG